MATDKTPNDFKLLHGGSVMVVKTIHILHSINIVFMIFTFYSTKHDYDVVTKILCHGFCLLRHAIVFF